MDRFVVAYVLLHATGAATASWSSEELSLYDLVEAVDANFYELFGIAKDASTPEVKKAYRKLSLEWHPDRNDAPHATAKFRQIVSIYEVLKSAELRAKYDNVVEFGLPDWRQPIYYYRKMRKLSWYEAVLVLLIVSTIAHYFMMWASYYEKFLVLSQTLRKPRKRDKKEENEESLQQLREALFVYRPQLRALLPFLIMKGLWRFFINHPQVFRDPHPIIAFSIVLPINFLVLQMLRMTVQDNITAVESVNERSIHEPRRVTPVARSPEFTYEVATDLKAVSPNDPESYAKYQSESEESRKKQSGDIWSCDELHQLFLDFLGTPNRWERVACVLNRTAEDVTAMAAKLKQIKRFEKAQGSSDQARKLAVSVDVLLEQCAILITIDRGELLALSLNCRRKNEDFAKLTMAQQSNSVFDIRKAKRIEGSLAEMEWSQAEQKQLEVALQRYPKGCENRWDRIAADIPTKSKEQCQERLKELVELVRRKKAGLTYDKT